MPPAEQRRAGTPLGLQTEGKAKSPLDGGDPQISLHISRQLNVANRPIMNSERNRHVDGLQIILIFLV